MVFLSLVCGSLPLPYLPLSQSLRMPAMCPFLLVVLISLLAVNGRAPVV